MNKYLIPKNYFDKILSYYHANRYSLEDVREIERNKFEKLGFRYDDAVNRINDLLNKSDKPDFSSQKGMGSIHWVLFCCIAGIASIRNILEIGTYDGETAFLLTKIFPDSEITTLDLPIDDPIFTCTYGRDTPEVQKRFKDTQKHNTSHPRILFFEKNSFFLPELVDKKYDLIWIDAGHLYPEIAWDICNAYHLCNAGGYIMCDDVITNKRGRKSGYVSLDSYDVLEYVSRRTNYNVTYFLKRDSPRRSADPKKRKYVALMQKSY